jgi:hypothetical protein
MRIPRLQIFATGIVLLATSTYLTSCSSSPSSTGGVDSLLIREIPGFKAVAVVPSEFCRTGRYGGVPAGTRGFLASRMQCWQGPTLSGGVPVAEYGWVALLSFQTHAEAETVYNEATLPQRRAVRTSPTMWLLRSSVPGSTLVYQPPMDATGVSTISRSGGLDGTLLAKNYVIVFFFSLGIPNATAFGDGIMSAQSRRIGV